MYPTTPCFCGSKKKQMSSCFGHLVPTRSANIRVLILIFKGVRRDLNTENRPQGAQLYPIASLSLALLANPMLNVLRKPWYLRSYGYSLKRKENISRFKTSCILLLFGLCSPPCATLSCLQSTVF